MTHAVVALAGEATLVVVECDEASQATQWVALLQAEPGGAEATATDRPDRAHGGRPTSG